MIELLALLLAPKIAPITEHHYQVGHCYKADKQEDNLIKIVWVSDENYLYEFINKNNNYFINSFTTIENVYTKETKCP